MIRQLLARVAAFCRAHPLVAGAIGMVVLLAFGFLHIADEMAEGDSEGFDRAILLALREHGGPNDAIGPDWLTVAATDVTSLGSMAVLTLIVVAMGGLFLSLGHRRQAAILVLASAGGLVWSQSLKLFFGRTRPEDMFRLVDVVNASFPSGHAMLSASVYLTLGALVARFAARRRVRAFALGSAVVVTVIVGTSRVYLGVHWASDVLAGWCLGGAWAIACWLALWLWERRGTSNP